MIPFHQLLKLKDFRVVGISFHEPMRLGLIRL
jgi:hypothetical protein